MGRRKDVDGRALLLEAALKLFAAQGVEGVSIRAVNREAGLGPASVHYHFGTKEALLDAVLHTYGHALIDQVKERAQEIADSEAPGTAHDLVTMLAAPYLDLMESDSDTGRSWVRLISQLLQSDPDRILDRPSAQLTWDAAARVYPDAAPQDLQRAMRMCLILLVSQLAQGRARRAGVIDLDLLFDFLSAGLDATLGAATPGLAGRRQERTARPA